jgi:hypothetical protein
MVKVGGGIKFVKIFKYIIGFMLIAILILIGSYHYTYVDIIPNYSEEDFQKFRIGTISTELPGTYSLARQSNIILEFPEHTLALEEFLLPDQCKSILGKTYVLDHEDSIVIDGIEYNFIMYYPKQIFAGNSSYATMILFSSGCTILEGLIPNGKEHTNKEHIFKDKLEIFLRHYQWLGNDSDIPKGFKTKFGVIRKNNHFKVGASYTFWDGETTESATTVIIFGFFPGVSSFSERQISIVDQYSAYLTARFRHANIIMGYGWTAMKRKIHFLDSYSGFEHIEMQASKKGVPEDLLYMDFRGSSNSSNCYSDTIEIGLLTNVFITKTKLTYNIFSGYWDKIINSECAAS